MQGASCRRVERYTNVSIASAWLLVRSRSDRNSKSMTRPDFDAAAAYAFERLAVELSEALLFHSLAHTRDDVLPALERLAATEHVTGMPLLLLRTAACFHDIGYVERRDGHEAAGVRIAAAALPRFGYSPAQIHTVAGMILSTRLPQNPRSLLARLLADADLDSLGRADFFDRNQALRAELVAFGIVASDAEWYATQLHFLRSHRYWTSAARELRDAVKAQNLAALARLAAQPLAHEIETDPPAFRD
jgi:uncharacterized protein